jgi:protein ImuB
MMGTLKVQRRLLALWFPRLPTDRLKRHKPQAFASKPLVVVEKEKNALRLFAVDTVAENFGLRVGQPLANARAMVPELDVVPANHHADAALLIQLADWCDRFTPAVALDAPDGLLLDIAGTHHLFGDDKNILEKILLTLRSKNFAVHGAVANTALSARALARYRDGSIVEEKGEAKAVSPLPIEALQLDPVTTHAFRRAGLKTIGQAAKRKRSEIVSRFGVATLNRIDEALGQGGKPITLQRPLPEYWKAQSFAEPVATLDVIRAELLSIAASLCATMEQQGVGARRLDASFYRTDGTIRHIAVETGGPICNAVIIDRLFNEKLASLSDPLDPGFGFDVIRLAATSVERIDHANISLYMKSHAEAEIDFLTDRLVARFGRECLVRFSPQATHVPEYEWLSESVQGYHLPQTSWQAIRTSHEAPRRPIRLFTNPQPVEIVQDPLRLFWRKVSRTLIQWEGPERISMEWWREKKPQTTRDYYRAEDAAGTRYWIYRNTSNAQWFLHGIFS